MACVEFRFDGLTRRGLLRLDTIRVPPCHTLSSQDSRAPTVSVNSILFFFKWRSQVLFVEPLIRLFRTYGDACPGFQCQDGFPHLCASFPVHNRFLRFTFDATPADLLTTSMAAGLFHPCEQALVWLESRKNHATASHHITRQTLYRLS